MLLGRLLNFGSAWLVSKFTAPPPAHIKLWLRIFVCLAVQGLGLGTNEVSGV